MGLCPSKHHRSHDQRGLCPGSLSRGVSVQGVSVQGVLCLGGIYVREKPLNRDPPYGKEQAVCILLECILVFLAKLSLSALLMSLEWEL